MATIPLPKPRPADANKTPPLSFEDLQSRIKAQYGSSCVVPPMRSIIPDTNLSYHEDNFTRQSFLDKFIKDLMAAGFDGTFSQTFATGTYGIESQYGNPKQDDWNGTYVGPLQVGTAYMKQYNPGGDIYDLQDQIDATIAFAKDAFKKLKEAFPNLTIDPFHIYLAHQQGIGGAIILIGADPSSNAGKTLTDGGVKNGVSHIKQAGMSKNYKTASVSDFLATQKRIFDASAARAGYGTCSQKNQWMLGISSASYRNPGIFAPPFSSQAANASPGSVSAGASGGGYTIYTQGHIAYGVLEINGVKKGYFLRSTYSGAQEEGGNVYLGSIDANNQLSWEQVFSSDGAVLAVSFGEKEFFVTYLIDTGDDVYRSRLAMTTNGREFIEGIDPFASLPSDNGVWNGPGDKDWGGNVAFLPDVGYCTICGVWISYQNENGAAVSKSLGWATSKNGLDWTAGYQPDVYAQPGAGYAYSFFGSNIAAGNGVFVAAGSYKNSFPEPHTHDPSEPNYVLDSAAVLTSANGSSWSPTVLPGPVLVGGEAGYENGDVASDCVAVCFVPDDSNGTDGYFMAAGINSGGGLLNEGAPVSYLWTSPGGFSWSNLGTQEGVLYGELTAIADDTSSTMVVTV